MKKLTKLQKRINKTHADAARRLREAQHSSAFMPRDEMTRNSIAFLYALDRSIAFHLTNTKDHHNVGNAVVVALTEVRDAFKAYMI